jgi:hypothetical protein
MDDLTCGMHARICAPRNSEYWKAEADRWREVALLQDAQIETIIAKLEHRMRKIESGIRELHD